jgi:hypothetical protein
MELPLEFVSKISGIQEVSTKNKQNWINNLERMDNTRLPKHALSYQPRGKRDHGRPRKRWQRSMPEQVKRPDPWKKKKKKMLMMI